MLDLYFWVPMGYYVSLAMNNGVSALKHGMMASLLHSIALQISLKDRRRGNLGAHLPTLSNLWMTIFWVSFCGRVGNELVGTPSKMEVRIIYRIVPLPVEFQGNFLASIWYKRQNSFLNYWQRPLSSLELTRSRPLTGRNYTNREPQRQSSETTGGYQSWHLQHSWHFWHSQR